MKDAGYTGNPDGKDIYPNDIDHGYGEPLAGGTDVMRRLQNELVHEQGNDDQVRPAAPEVPNMPGKGRQSALDASLEKLGRFTEGVPADPTENMSPEDAAKWHEMNDKYGDVVKDQHKTAATDNVDDAVRHMIEWLVKFAAEFNVYVKDPQDGERLLKGLMQWGQLLKNLKAAAPGDTGALQQAIEFFEGIKKMVRGHGPRTTQGQLFNLALDTMPRGFSLNFAKDAVRAHKTASDLLLEQALKKFALPTSRGSWRKNVPPFEFEFVRDGVKRPNSTAEYREYRHEGTGDGWIQASLFVASTPAGVTIDYKGYPRGARGGGFFDKPDGRTAGFSVTVDRMWVQFTDNPRKPKMNGIIVDLLAKLPRLPCPTPWKDDEGNVHDEDHCIIDVGRTEFSRPLTYYEEKQGLRQVVAVQLRIVKGTERACLALCQNLAKPYGLKVEILRGTPTKQPQPAQVGIVPREREEDPMSPIERLLGRKPGRLACDSGIEGKFEEGKPADPTENMSPEDAANWNKQQVFHKDEFKEADALDRAAGLLLAKEDYPWDQCIKDKEHDPKVDDPEAVCGWIKNKNKTAAARKLSDIALEIMRDWKPINYAARPYVEAMRTLDTIRDNYGADSARSIVAYFLANAGTWRGETAKRVKAELNALLKNKTAAEALDHLAGLFEKTAMEHATEEARRNYLHEHPNANPRNHTVKAPSHGTPDKKSEPYMGAEQAKDIVRGIRKKAPDGGLDPDTVMRVLEDRNYHTPGRALDGWVQAHPGQGIPKDVLDHALQTGTLPPEGAAPKKDEPKKDAPAKKTPSDKPKDEGKKDEPAKPKKKTWKTQKDHDEHHADEDYATANTPGYHPQKAPPGLKHNPKALAAVPASVREWADDMPDKDMDSSEAYNHPAIKKLQKYLRGSHTNAELGALYKETQDANGKLVNMLRDAKTDKDTDEIRFVLRHNYAVWRAINGASQDPVPKKMKDKGEGRPGKKPEAKKPSYSKKYHANVREVMDKHDLTDDDADEVKKFKGDKPHSGVKLSDAELLRRFLQHAKPETKERMKGVSPAEFVKMLGAIMDDEEGGGGGGGKQASLDPLDRLAGLVTADWDGEKVTPTGYDPGHMVPSDPRKDEEPPAIPREACDQTAHGDFTLAEDEDDKTAGLNPRTLRRVMEMGQDARRKGRPQNPGLDQELLQLIKATPGGFNAAAPLLDAWANGWHGQPMRVASDLQPGHMIHWACTATGPLVWQEIDGVKVAKNLPPDVERYVEEAKEQDPGIDEGKAWAIAWSRWCKYKSPGDEHCQKAPSDYFSGRSAAANERIDLFAAVYGDGALWGVTEAPQGRQASFWPQAVRADSDFKVYRLANVPMDIAQRLADQGTTAQHYRDGYVAWDVAKRYAQGVAPEHRASVEVEAARAPSGLYGFKKTVQADCEGCIRKLSRTAAALAKQAWRKDERVAEFLGTHARRANSVPAKVMLAALREIGPRVASLTLVAGKGPDRDGADWREVKDNLGHRWTWVDTADKCAPAFSIIEQAGKKGGDPQYLVQLVLPDGAAFKHKGLLGSLALAFLTASIEYRMLTPEPSVKEWTKAASQAMTARVEDWEAASASNWQRVASAKFGLYGFPQRTASLGLNACTALREAAGQIASELHGRRTAAHADITGFLQAHAKEAQCHYARLLHASYPEAAAKTASAERQAMLEWEE